MRRAVILAVLAASFVVVLPGLAENEWALINSANQAIDAIVKVAIDRIGAADAYAQMLFWANWAENQVFLMLTILEQKIGPVDYEAFCVIVYNETVGCSVAFDPIHVVGSGQGG